MIRLLSILLSLTLITCGWPDSANAQPPSERQAAEETEIDGLRLIEGAGQDPHLATLGITLGYVEKETRPGGGKYLCGGMSRDKSLSAGTTIATALRRVPDSSLRKLGLRYVILCSRAIASGQPIGGIPVPPLNLLMLDVSETADDALVLQHGVLHELYHFMEFRFNTFQDPEWQERFGAGYANSYSGRLKRAPIGSGKRGFLNAYAETYPHEERAELFASLLLRPANVAAQIRVTNDQVLNEKVLYMIEKCRRLIGLRIAFPAR